MFLQTVIFYANFSELNVHDPFICVICETACVSDRWVQWRDSPGKALRLQGEYTNLKYLPEQWCCESRKVLDFWLSASCRPIEHLWKNKNRRKTSRPWGDKRWDYWDSSIQLFIQFDLTSSLGNMISKAISVLGRILNNFFRNAHFSRKQFLSWKSIVSNVFASTCSPKLSTIYLYMSSWKTINR